MINFRMPFGEIPIKIADKHDKIVLRATKIRPMGDWGPVEDCFEVAFRDKNLPQQNPYDAQQSNNNMVY